MSTFKWNLEIIINPELAKQWNPKKGNKDFISSPN